MVTKKLTKNDCERIAELIDDGHEIKNLAERYGVHRVPDIVKKLLADYGLEWQEVERRVVLPDDWQRTLKDF